MCFTLTDLELIKKVAEDIESEAGFALDQDQVQTLLVCALVERVPGITTTTTAELDRLTDEDWHTTVRAIHEIQKEYLNFIKHEKELDFRKYWKC
tara:strand:+ start:2056 stop:2340 length:285 start_codon:yes stop_codon:yes gene_type:complete